MKTLLAGIIIGGLLVFNIMSRTQKPIVERELAWRSKWETREIHDTTYATIPIPIPGTNDTLFYPIDSLPYKEYSTIDSLPIFINDEQFASSYALVFGYRGKAERYKTKPIANRFRVKPATPRASAFMLYGGVGTDQSLQLKNSFVEVGTFAFYKRVGLHGRFEIYPRDTIEVKLKFMGAVRL